MCVRVRVWAGLQAHQERRVDRDFRDLLLVFMGMTLQLTVSEMSGISLGDCKEAKMIRTLTGTHVNKATHRILE